MNILFEVSPIGPSGQPTTLRMAHASAKSSSTQIDGHQWVPLISKRPTVGVELMDVEGNLAESSVRRGAIEFRLSPDYENETWAKFVWAGAPAKAWVGNFGAPFSEYVQIFDGMVGPFSREGVTATIELLGPEAILDTNLLSKTYAGTGGEEGPKELEGNLKPWCSGRAKNVAPVLVDTARWIYQVHGYGPVQSIPKIYEFAQALAAPVAQVETFAELAGLDLKPGETAVCTPLGMFRLGGAPTHKVTADVIGAKDGVSAPESIATIVPHLLKVAGVPAAKIGSFDRFIGSTWDLYADSQTTVGEVIRDAMVQVGAYVIADGTGTWQCGDFYLGKPPKPLRSDRSVAPLVRPGSIKELTVAEPVWRAEVGYDRCWSTHTDAEISPALKDLVDTVETVTGPIKDDIKDIKDALGNALGESLQPIYDWADGLAEMNLRALTVQDRTTNVVRTEAFTKVEELREETLADGTRLQQQVEALGVTVDDSVSALQHEITLRANEIEANAQEIDLLVTRVGDNEAALVEERTARTTELEALASDFDGLQVSVGGQITAGLEAERTARATAISAETTARTNQVSQLSTALTSSIQSEATTRSNQDGALSTRIEQVSARAEGAHSRVTDESSARADADGALSGRITTAQARADSAYSNATTALEASSTFGSRWTVSLNTNGWISGMVLANGGQGKSETVFLSDVFRIVTSGGGLVSPFSASGNTVYMDQVVARNIGAGTITADKIVGGAVSNMLQTEVGSLMSFGVNSESQHLSWGYSSEGGKHLLSVYCETGTTGSTAGGSVVRVYCNGSLIGTGSIFCPGSWGGVGLSVPIAHTPGIGYQNYTVTYSGTSGSGAQRANRTSLVLTELKK